MKKVRVFRNRKGRNLIRWLWASTNLFMPVVVGDLQRSINLLGKDGGTVLLGPGSYDFPDFRDNVHLIGAGPQTVLKLEEPHGNVLRYLLWNLTIRGNRQL